VVDQKGGSLIFLIFNRSKNCMRQLISDNKWFLLPYLLIVLAIGIILVIFTKSEIHIYINSCNSDFFDYFFKYLTNFGDGICLPFFLLLVVIAFKYRDGLYLLVVFLIAGLVVQLLKRTIFHEIVRPLKFFGDSVHLHLVNGVDQLSYNSFPSGHSATAFGFYLCFALIVKNNLLKISLLVLACLVAFSRVYLSQHFLIDIFAGSLIGVITAIACYFWIYSLKSSWLDKNLKTINFKMK
jgi:membrane-associated phospholipid phosphatase